MPTTRAPRANPRAAINEGREEEKITSILVSSQRLIVTSWFAITLAAGMRVRRIWREKRVLVMTLAMNMAKTSQSCLKDFVKTKFRKIMLPQKQGNTFFYFPVPFACSPHLVPRFRSILASQQSYNPITEILVIYACRSLALNTPVNRPISIYLNSNLAKRLVEIKPKRCIIHYGASRWFFFCFRPYASLVWILILKTSRLDY